MPYQSFHFSKYHGNMNDFIITQDSSPLSPSVVQGLCDRRSGIGADGFIQILPLHKADFQMRYFNSDGNLGSFCGNGARCSVAFAYREGIIKKKESIQFESCAGLHHASIKDDGSIGISFKDLPIDKITKLGDAFVLDTGSPHYIQYVDNIENIPVAQRGKEIRQSPFFDREGINVNFVLSLHEKFISIRTYERGVEAETFACGTGTVAAGLVQALKNNLSGAHSIEVKTKGGGLKLHFYRQQDTFKNIYLWGAAQKVFDGKYVLGKA